jgi:hypothetical protein
MIELAPATEFEPVVDSHLFGARCRRSWWRERKTSLSRFGKSAPARRARAMLSKNRLGAIEDLSLVPRQQEMLSKNCLGGSRIYDQ